MTLSNRRIDPLTGNINGRALTETHTIINLSADIGAVRYGFRLQDVPVIDTNNTFTVTDNTATSPTTFSRVLKSGNVTPTISSNQYYVDTDFDTGLVLFHSSTLGKSITVALYRAGECYHKRYSDCFCYGFNSTSGVYSSLFSLLFYRDVSR